jgi:hypothetical protein
VRVATLLVSGTEDTVVPHHLTEQFFADCQSAQRAHDLEHASTRTRDTVQGPKGGNAGEEDGEVDEEDEDIPPSAPVWLLTLKGADHATPLSTALSGGRWSAVQKVIELFADCEWRRESEEALQDRIRVFGAVTRHVLRGGDDDEF